MSYDTIDTRMCDNCGSWREHCQCLRCEDCGDVLNAFGQCESEECNVRAGEAQDGKLWADVDMASIDPMD